MARKDDQATLIRSRRSSFDNEGRVPVIYPGDPQCPKCEGKGVIDVVVPRDFGVPSPMEEMFGGLQATQNCECKDRKVLAEFFTPKLAKYPMIKNSPYLKWRSRHLYLTARQDQFYPHLKTVLYKLRSEHLEKGLGFKFNIVTDLFIVEAKLGKIEDFGSTNDYDKFNMLIVLTGHLHYKNVAASGYVNELLGHREMEGLTTWVVEPPTSRIRQGTSLIWSPDLEDRLTGQFTQFVRHIENTEVRMVERAVSIDEIDAPNYELMTTDVQPTGSGRKQVLRVNNKFQ